MADYIFIRKSRNALSSILHIFLNLALAIASIGATVLTGNCLIGLVLVLVSKWRIFAVNHRYWLLNLRSSLVDFIVGISFVMIAYNATVVNNSGSTFLLIHYILMALYAIWLILIKPRSSTILTIIQALTAVFFGTTAAVLFDTVADSWLLVLLEFIIGFAASHHVLIQGEKDDYLFISLVCGLFFAEIAWLAHAWLITYKVELPGVTTTGICVSQLSIILSVLAFTYFQIYNELVKNNGKLKFANVALPVIFSIAVTIVLLVGFSLPRFNIH